MKLLVTISLTVSSVAILLAVSSLRGTDGPFFVNIGTHRFLLTFDDTSLTKSQRTAIVADLQHEYTSLTNLPVILHDSATKTTGYVEFTAYGITPTTLTRPCLYQGTNTCDYITLRPTLPTGTHP